MSYARGGAFTALGRNIRDLGSTAGALRREEEERRLAAEDRERLHQFQDVNMAMSLDERGGGMGGAPRTVEELGPRRELSEPDPIIPEPTTGFNPAGADSLLQTPEFERRPAPDSSFRMETMDPNFIEVGDGYAHFERGDSRSRRLEDEASDRFRSRVAPGLEGFASGSITPETEGFGTEAANLLDQGVDPRTWMPKPIEEPPEDQWQSRLRTAQEHGVSPREYILGREPIGRSGSGSEVGFTPLQILNHAQERYAIYEKDEQGRDVLAGYSIPEEEIRRLAAAEARGEPVEWPEAPGREEVQGPVGLSMEEALDIRGDLPRFRTRSWKEQELQRSGYNPQEIELILGPRRGGR
jgi:hypothetical protein